MSKKTLTKDPTRSNKAKLSSRNLALDLSHPQQTQGSKNGKKSQGTKVTIKYDVGFKNALFVRGRGANLSWEKGIQLKNTRADEWVWEPETPFTHCEFKILINDAHYEHGENHHLNNGMKILYTPHF